MRAVLTLALALASVASTHGAFTFGTGEQETTLAGGGGLAKGEAKAHTVCVDKRDPSWVYAADLAANGIRVMRLNGTEVVSSTLELGNADATLGFPTDYRIVCTEQHVFGVSQSHAMVANITEPGTLAWVSGTPISVTTWDDVPDSLALVGDTGLFFGGTVTLDPQFGYLALDASGDLVEVGGTATAMDATMHPCVSADGRYRAFLRNTGSQLDIATSRMGNLAATGYGDIQSVTWTSDVNFFPGACVWRDNGGAHPDLYLLGSDNSGTIDQRAARVVLGGTLDAITVDSTTYGPLLGTEVNIESSGPIGPCVLSPSEQVAYCAASVVGGASTAVAYVFDADGDVSTGAVPTLSGDAAQGFGLGLSGDGATLVLSSAAETWVIPTNDVWNPVTAPLLAGVAMPEDAATHLPLGQTNVFGFTTAVVPEGEDVGLQFACTDNGYQGGLTFDTYEVNYENGTGAGSEVESVDTDDLLASPGADSVARTLANGTALATTGVLAGGVYRWTPRAPRNATDGYHTLAKPRVVAAGHDVMVNHTGTDLQNGITANFTASFSDPVTKFLKFRHVKTLLYAQTSPTEVQILSRNTTDGSLTYLSTQTLASATVLYSHPRANVLIGLDASNNVVAYTAADYDTGLLAIATQQVVHGSDTTTGFLGVASNMESSNVYAVFATETGGEHFLVQHLVDGSGTIGLTPRREALSGTLFPAEGLYDFGASAVRAVVPVEQAIANGGEYGLSCVQLAPTLLSCGYTNNNIFSDSDLLFRNAGLDAVGYASTIPVRAEGSIGVVCSDRRAHCAYLTETGFRLFQIDRDSESVNWLQTEDGLANCTRASWHDSSLIMVCGDTARRFNEGTESGLLTYASSATPSSDGSEIGAVEFLTRVSYGDEVEDTIYLGWGATGNANIDGHEHDPTTASPYGVTGLASNAVYEGEIPALGFTLPEAEFTGSIVLEFNMTGLLPHLMAVETAALGAGAHALTDIALWWAGPGQASPLSPANDARLPNGTGSLTLAYRDTHGNDLARSFTTYTNVTLITECSDPNLDPRYGCTNCSWRFANDSGSTCVDCAEGYFGSTCRETQAYCNSTRCNGQGSCLTQTTTSPSTNASVDPTQQCACATGYFGHGCEQTASICTDDRCGGRGACVGQYASGGCTCEAGHASPADPNLLGCTVCNGTHANYTYVYNATDGPSGGCIMCAPGQYGSDCSLTAPVCAAVAAADRLACVDLEVTVTGADQIVGGASAVTPTNASGCECFYAWDAETNYTTHRCGDGGEPLGYGATCRCEPNRLWSGDAAHAENQCVLRCRHESVYNVTEDACKCAAGAACGDFSGALFNHGVNDQDNAVITVALISLAVVVIVVAPIWARGLCCRRRRAK